MVEISKPFVSFQADDELLAKLEEMVAEDFVNRSIFIRRLILQEYARREKARVQEREKA